MRSGGSVLEAPPGAEEGALPREYEHEAASVRQSRLAHPPSHEREPKAAWHILPPVSMSSKPPAYPTLRILNAHGIIAL